MICVVSSADSPDVIVEDIAALSALSNGSKIIVISDAEIGGVFDAVSNIVDILIIPERKDNAQKNKFLKKCAGMHTDILYCRKASDDAFTREFLPKINAGITILLGNSLKKLALKGQVIKIEDENSRLNDVMPFIPEVKIQWKLSSEILRSANAFLKERGVKKSYFCADIALERDFYEFFKNYPDDNISFLFVGNSESDFSNERSKIIYSGDISNSYLSALVSLSKGCLIMNDDLLLTEANHFEKRFVKLFNDIAADVKLKNFIDRNK
ncbi:MAG: hypothetical protein LBH98_07400 [Chitinispirillales bacterium]|nr:hypothetical protein [Chitinispirillales bacterium]